jgi:predicted PurR-regulated permease PerM
MRKFVVAACLFLGIAAAVPSAFAAVDAAGLAQIQAILSANPNGGDALAAAIQAAVDANPALVDDVLAAAANATPDQQSAIGTGLGNAANDFANLGTSDGTAAHDAIVTAVANSGLVLVLASLDAAIVPTAGGNNNANPLLTQNTNRPTQNSCVSPSRPGPC